MMAAHYIQAMSDHDNDLLEKLAAKDYAVTTIVPDSEFYLGLLELIDGYMKRNGVSAISKEEDDAILSEEKEYNDALNKLMDDGE